MLCKNNVELKKIVKFIDYVYLNNYIRNSLIKENYSNQNLNLNNDWKIFSTQYKNDDINILNFIKIIRIQPNYSDELLLLTTHIYVKICVEYAHLIENYTYLFASIYIAININNIMLDEYLTCNFLAKFLNINLDFAKQMINLVEKFMIESDIYFGSNEKDYIINNITND